MNTLSEADDEEVVTWNVELRVHLEQSTSI